MPTRLNAPLLSVDAGMMHQIDTRNVENLFSMWTVFNRCADSIDQGRRLENLSWRLWNRETFCCEPKAEFANPPARLDRTPRQSTHEVPVPQLSTSVDSASSEEYEPESSRQTPPSPVTIRALSSTSNSSIESLSASGRSKPKPISSQAWEKVVISINQTKITQRHDMTALPESVTAALRPLSSQSSVAPESSTGKSVSRPQVSFKQTLPRASHSSASTVPLSSPGSSLARSQTCGSQTSAELISAPDVVRGFTPNSISSHRMSVPLVSEPESGALKTARSGKQPQFMLGGTSSSSDEEASSVEDKMAFQRRTGPCGVQTKTPGATKQASFNDRVEMRRFVAGASDDEGAIASEDEDDVDESAIEEEDDEDDWDDASDDGEPEALPAPVFKRIDSKANLTSRRSLITSALHQTDRANQLAAQASTSQSQLRRSRTTSPNGPSLAASVEEEPMEGIKINRPKPIITTTNTHPPALSPRTTRRNMLATELTESLRKHLLWERQQKNVTANAVLKRRHTSQDVANLRRHPGLQDSGSGSKTNSLNHYFENGLGEYHSKGW